MLNNIKKLLEEYEDEIMKNTLGDIVDEYGDRYAEVYQFEWRDHKEMIAHVLDEIKSSGVSIVPIGLAYIIITEWSGVMTFSKGDLSIDGLEKVCEKILDKLI